jgi:Fungal chitosanase of glycosyl hydrolase group 75
MNHSYAHLSWYITLTLFSATSCPYAVAEPKKPAELPPQEILDAVLQHAAEPPVIVFPKKVDGAKADPLCGMLPTDLNVSRGDKSRTYKILIDASAGDPPEPTNVFFRIVRLTVDADGSSRAYHPDDPLGIGVCEPGKPTACAVDKLSSADIAVFQGTTEVRPKETAQDSAEYLSAWSKAWSLISADPAASVTHKTDPRIPEPYALYYFGADNLTVVFKTTIIPFHGGAPCMRDHKAGDPGYFVAATSFTKTKVTPQTACDPANYLDASKVPFVVIPGDIFGNVRTGDIAVGVASNNRFIYGIVGDKGPPFKTAEASIAFNSKMLGRATPLVNAADLDNIDITLPTDHITAMGVLILGGTRVALKGDFTADNIAAVGGRMLKSWSPKRDARKRLTDCLKAAPVNPWKEK